MNFFSGTTYVLIKMGYIYLFLDFFSLLFGKVIANLTPKTLWVAYLDLDVAGTLWFGQIRTPYSLQGCERMTDILSDSRTMFKNLQQFTNFKKWLDRFLFYQYGHDPWSNKHFWLKSSLILKVQVPYWSFSLKAGWSNRLWSLNVFLSVSSCQFFNIVLLF